MEGPVLHRPLGRLLAGILAVLLTATGCAAASPAAPEPAPAAGTARFVYDGTLDVITEWDPALAYADEPAALQNIYETLTRWNPATASAVPRLATSWRASPDGLRWTFTLRAGVRFHTGRALDADLVKTAIERTKRIGGKAAYIWDAVADIRADAPLTVTFLLAYAVPLDRVASAGYAAYVYDPAGIDLKGGGDGGSGPYTIDSWRPERPDRLVLKAFDPYWGGWDRPHYRRVLFHVAAAQSENWRRLARGESTLVSRITARQYAGARATGTAFASREPSYQILLMLFNSRTGPLADLRLRRALRLAVDYDGLLSALRGSVSPAAGIVPAGLPGHQRGSRPRQNLKAAAGLLRRAGYGPGGRPLTLTLTYTAGDDDQRLLVAGLTRTLRSLNVRLEARAMPWSARLARGRAGGQDIFLMYWWPDYPDGYSYFNALFRSADPPVFNLSYARDAEVDGLVDSLPRLAATDRAGAERVYARLTRRVLDELALAAVPWVVTYQRAYSLGVWGYQDNPAYPNVVFVYDLRPSA